MPVRGRYRIILAAWAALGAGSAGALEFEFQPSSRTPAAVLDAFVAAGSQWAARFTDPITIRIDLDYRTLPAGWLADTVPQTERVDYSVVRSLLTADRNSADDAVSVSSLQAGPNLNLLLNRTPANPTTPYLDDDGDRNNYSIRTSTANLKAIGRSYSPTLVDARMTFNSTVNWDFDRTDGIGAGLYDLVGVATHELGHALGFSSGVDMLDSYGSLLPDSQWTYVTIMDLHRYSAESVANGTGVIDFSADSRGKYFSIDGGLTELAPFATGAALGDGRQASHWKAGMGLGIMDPVVSPGKLLTIADLDLRLFDVIGYDRRPGPLDLTVAAGERVAIEGPGIVAAGSTMIAAGAELHLLGEAGPTLVVEKLTIIDEGLLNLGRGALVVRAEDPLEALGRINGWILASRNGGDEPWQGWGLSSDWVVANPHLTLAAILNARADGSAIHDLFAGQTVGAGDILVRSAWLGDLDLDGIIDTRDFEVLRGGLLGGGLLSGYGYGDLNYDGSINADDWFLMDRSYLAWTEVSETSHSLPVTPEPASALTAALASLLMLRRGRR